MGQQEARVNIRSNLFVNETIGNNAYYAYNHQHVTFQCTAQGTGTFVLSWISDEYIGPGNNVLQISNYNVPGYRANSSMDQTTYATLSYINNTDNEIIEIGSMLNIIVSMRYSTYQSVGCRHNGHGEPQIINFSKADIRVQVFTH